MGLTVQLMSDIRNLLEEGFATISTHQSINQVYAKSLLKSENLARKKNKRIWKDEEETKEKISLLKKILTFLRLK